MSLAEHKEELFQTVLSRFRNMQEDPSLADAIFRVGNDGNTKDIPVISALLGTASPVFKALLFGRLQEAQPTMDIVANNSQSLPSTDNLLPRPMPKKYVRLDDVSPEAFEHLKGVLYATQPTINESIAANVTYLAKKYLLTSLYNFSMAFISELVTRDIPSFLKVLFELHNHALKDEVMDMAHSFKTYGHFPQTEHKTSQMRTLQISVAAGPLFFLF